MEVIDQASGRDWVLFNGDSAEVLKSLPDGSVDFTIYSPPFSSLYTYTPSERDLGNVRNEDEFFAHFGYISTEIMRVMKPGRIMCVHCADLPRYQNRYGFSGRYDFSGDLLRHFVNEGWYFHSRITVNKDPQAQAIRNHSKGLLFVQLRRDQRWLWQAWADYILVLRSPGECDTPVVQQLTEEEWIRDAAPVWDDIRSTDVLSVAGSKESEDDRHICPLQLPVIRRCLRLWTNEGETVLDPFNGIGSSGYEAIKLGRKYIGVELKPTYYEVACRNLRDAEAATLPLDLFTVEEPESEAVA